MTASETLRTAAALMREQHGPSCPDHEFWQETANLLDRASSTATAVAQVYGPGVVGERSIPPLRVARAYLATQEVRT